MKGEPRFVVDGTELLNEGEVPLEHVNALLSQLSAEEYVLLLTDFEPSPIIDAMQKQGRTVHHKIGPDGSGRHFTSIHARATP